MLNTEKNYNAFCVFQNPNIIKTYIEKDSIQIYKSILHNMSSNNFTDDVWEFSETLNFKVAKIDFNILKFINQNELSVIKCWVISELNDKIRCSTINKDLKNLSLLFLYLRKNHLFLNNLKSCNIDDFFNSTDGNINDISSSLNKFFIFLKAEKIITLSLSFKKFKEKVTAGRKTSINKSVLKKIDELFFNLNNEIPTDVRAAYMIMRFIPNRVSEVLHMKLDCLSYPEENVFSLSIPTTKSEKFHNIKYYNYERYLTGQTQYLHYTVKKQLDFASAKQQTIPEKYKGYLFVDCNNPKNLLTDVKFNKYLNDLCEKYKIYDENNRIAHVTSHMLRHSVAVSLSRFDIYGTGSLPLSLLKSEMNHNDDYSMFSYFSESAHDSKAKTKIINKEFYENAFINNEIEEKNKKSSVKREIP